MMQRFYVQLHLYCDKHVFVSPAKGAKAVLLLVRRLSLFGLLIVRRRSYLVEHDCQEPAIFVVNNRMFRIGYHGI